MGLRDWWNNKKTKNKSEENKSEENKLEENKLVKNKTRKKEFVPKVKIEDFVPELTREDILSSMTNDIMAKDLSETYQENQFEERLIRENYDKHAILSNKDMVAIGRLYGAIKEGNEVEFPYYENNKINCFLKENPDNIIALIDLMIKDGEKEYEQIKREDAQMISQLSVVPETLIPGTYADISTIIDYYRQEEIMERE